MMKVLLFNLMPLADFGSRVSLLLARLTAVAPPYRFTTNALLQTCRCAGFMQQLLHA